MNLEISDVWFVLIFFLLLQISTPLLPWAQEEPKTTSLKCWMVDNPKKNLPTLKVYALIVLDYLGKKWVIFS